jgi:hypothetical protein
LRIGCFLFRALYSAEVGQGRLRVPPEEATAPSRVAVPRSSMAPPRRPHSCDRPRNRLLPCAHRNQACAGVVLAGPDWRDRTDGEFAREYNVETQ